MSIPRGVEELARRAAEGGGPFLSVYLNLDPGNRRAGVKLVLEDMLKEIASDMGEEERRRFEEAAARVRREVELHIPRGRSLAVFCDASSGVVLKEELPVPIANRAWYGDAPYVRPLLETLREYERFAVVLADRERARIFLVTLGEIEEVADTLSAAPVKARKTTGSDRLMSSGIVERRAETWSGWFLRDVCGQLTDVAERHRFDRILLAGPEDVTAELLRLLPKALAARVAERLRMPVSARPQEVLALVAPVIERLDRVRQKELVADLVTAARSRGTGGVRAVLGAEATLDAVNQGRVYTLVYAAGLALKGFTCGGCGVALDHGPRGGACPYCSQPLEPAEDLVALAAGRVLAAGGKIEEIRDPDAAADLSASGGLGAWLR